MADINIDGVVTWLKNWFYDKTEMGTLLNAKANLNQNQANYNVVTDASGNITVEAKPTIPSDVSELTDNNNTQFTPKSHTHNSTEVTVPTNLPNLGIYSGQTQHQVNNAIDEIVATWGTALEIVDTLPTANSSTMGKIYVITEAVQGVNKVNFYFTRRSGTSPNYTYAWEKMDVDILDELRVQWTDITGKPSEYNPTVHSSPNTTYGVGSTVGYGHTKVIDDLTHSSYAQGESLSAYQGYLLEQNKGAKTDDVDWTYSSNGFTNGVKLVSKSDNANGRITLHLKS